LQVNANNVHVFTIVANCIITLQIVIELYTPQLERVYCNYCNNTL